MSTTDPENTCVYVTRGWGVHDERWRTAIADLGYTTICVNAGEHAEEDLKAVVAHVANPAMPIIAGPLDSVTPQLIGINAPLIGLSWGFDLHQASNLDWLAHLAGLIVDSTATRSIAEAAGVPKENITVLPWGVDLNVFTPNGPRMDLNRWELDANTKVILSLRAHEPLYRVQDIINAFASIHAQHTQAVLLIGNDGSLTPQLKKHVTKSGLDKQIRFIEKIPEVELPALLRSTSVYVSASEVDGTSVTLLQAMACGTRALVSDTSGNRDWITQKTGTMFETGSPDSLAQALHQQLINPNTATDLTTPARELVTKHADWYANQTRLGDAIQRALLH